MNERSFIFQNKKAKEMPTQPLLSSFKLGKLELSNRIVMAPLTRSRADNPENAPTELHAEYYSQRASAGLIITEATQVSKQGVGYINTPGIHSAAQIEGWKKVTKAVHEAGGKIFLQLWHVGYVSHPDFHNGELPVSASAVNPNTKSFTPQGFKDTVESRALTIEEIKETIQDYRRGARNAIDAGMNGVEVHGANGYLIDQLFDIRGREFILLIVIGGIHCRLKTNRCIISLFKTNSLLEFTPRDFKIFFKIHFGNT